MTEARNKKKLPSRRWVFIILATVVLIAFDLSPLGGNLKFYTTWIKCGRKPVEVATNFMGVGAPYYREVSSIEPVRFGYSTYYCSPQKAEEAGFSASPDRYEFKYLKQ